MTNMYVIQLSQSQKDFLTEQLDSFERMCQRDPARFLELGVKFRDIAEVVAAAEEVDVKKTRKPAVKTEDKWQPNLCKEHPDYTAAKPPRIACDGHWKAYKKLHPLEYDVARKKFDRNSQKNDGKKL